jgi:hypothetical protein
MMSIRDGLQKIKSFDDRTLSDLYVVALVILVGLSSFGLGRLSVEDDKSESVRITTTNLSTAAGVPYGGDNTTQAVGQTGQLVASRNGSKYHYPWCLGAGRMKEENKIWFDSIEAARKAGYTPAANCKGLK